MAPGALEKGHKVREELEKRTQPHTCQRPAGRWHQQETLATPRPPTPLHLVSDLRGVLGLAGVSVRVPAVIVQAVLCLSKQCLQNVDLFN